MIKLEKNFLIAGPFNGYENFLSSYYSATLVSQRARAKEARIVKFQVCESTITSDNYGTKAFMEFDSITITSTEMSFFFFFEKPSFTTSSEAGCFINFG